MLYKAPKFLIGLIKDKAGTITAKDNYRPIALASVLSKIIELIILDRIKTCLLTSPNQFGFKQSHGTDQCIFAYKGTFTKKRKWPYIGSKLDPYMPKNNNFPI